MRFWFHSYPIIINTPCTCAILDHHIIWLSDKPQTCYTNANWKMIIVANGLLYSRPNSLVPTQQAKNRQSRRLHSGATWEDKESRADRWRFNF
jgi:hypothetical protein